MTGTANRVLRRLRRTIMQAVPTVACVVVIDFFLLRLAPGNAADALAGASGSATAATMTMLRAELGLNRPLWAQFLAYLDTLAHFSLGYSPLYGMPVAALIGQRLAGSLLLMGIALGIALALGILMGVVMARFAGGWIDWLLSVVALLLYSLPGFWIALMLIVLFSVRLGWLPSGGEATLGASAGGWAWIGDHLAHLLLPAVTLSLFFIAIYARLVRASMMQVRGQDYIRTARAKGLTERAVALRHALRNALLPVTTVAGMHAGAILGGSVVVETVFAWPGVGRLAFEALLRRDFTVLLGILLLSALVVIAVNMLVDLVQAWLDPRIEDA